MLRASSNPPIPALLPMATTVQTPNTSAYAALNVPALRAGDFYLDPTTKVKVHKLTDASFPAGSGAHWAHDYSEGNDEVSLPIDDDGTRSILVLRQGDWTHWLIDFVPNPTNGSRVRNPRQLIGVFAPNSDINFTFSSNPATPYYAYVVNGNTIRRINFVTMTDAPDAVMWPITDSGTLQWLHQSANDEMFVWMRAGAETLVGYNPALGTTNGVRTHMQPGLNEPRIDRGGRYIGLSMNNGAEMHVWDWDANALAWSYTDPSREFLPFAHQASLRRRWVGHNWNVSAPYVFCKWTSDVPQSGSNLTGPAPGDQLYVNGNWVQNPADLDDQWALSHHYGALQPPPPQNGTQYLAPGGMILMTPIGQRRLLGHMYNAHPYSGAPADYFYLSFCKFSPDGNYVLFTSDMNTGSGRSDLFLAELPTA